MTQKSMKLDPNAYEALTMTKKYLEKYLRRKFSYGDAVRWLCYTAEDRLSTLYQASSTIDLHLSEALGTNPARPYAVRMYEMENAKGASRRDAQSAGAAKTK